MAGIGLPELLIILIIVVMVFGAKRIPEIMGGIGKGIKSFKRSLETDDAPTPPPAQPTSPAESSKEKIENR
ncbi:MAG: twin-arginine translocase TatA/TatE family subunit [Deltaproteobacteria bacterium]|nr:twin-arginine translocase TatA/TatE family subunit [Deltaproteobacteria bacterium]